MFGNFINFKKYRRCLSLFGVLSFFLSSVIVKADPNSEGKKSENDTQVQYIDQGDQSESVENLGKYKFDNADQSANKIKSSRIQKAQQNSENVSQEQEIVSKGRPESVAKSGEPPLANENQGSSKIKPSRIQRFQQNSGNLLTNSQNSPQNENDTEALYLADIDTEMKTCTIILSSQKEFTLEDSRLKHIVYGEKDGVGGGHTKRSVDYRAKSEYFEVKDVQYENGYRYKVRTKDGATRLETKSVFPIDWEVRDIISAIGFCLENYVNLRDEGLGVKEYISCYYGVCICVICNGSSVVTAFPLNPSSYYFISNSTKDSGFYDRLKPNVIFYGDKWICSPIKKSLIENSFSYGVTPKQRCLEKFWSEDSKMAIRNLFHAAMHDHVDILSYLLDKGIDINVLDDNERTPLIVAIEKGNLEAVKFLIESGADLNVSTYEVGTPLHVALKNHYEKITLFLLTKGVDVNALNLYGRAPLHIAAESSSAEIVTDLLAKGATADIRDSFLNPPMFFVFQSKVLDVLLENNIDINAVNSDGENFLHFMMRKNTRRTVSRLASVLFKLKFDVNSKDAWGMTILHIAACKNDLDSIKFLLSKKVFESFQPEVPDINAQDSKGLTPLYIAAQYRCYDVVKFLLSDPRVDKNIKDNAGRTFEYYQTLISIK